MRARALALSLAVQTGCAPPPAPQGLQDSLSYLFRNFYAEDEIVAAGLTGFMDWFEADGGELLDQRADMDNVGTFALDYLTQAEVAHLPIEGTVELTYAPGGVALSDMPCTWDEVDGYLARTDQDEVFGEFDSYERTFVTPRADYEATWQSGEFADVKEPIDPFADGFEIGELSPSFLLTDNQTSSTELGVTMAFELILNMRHGLYEIQGEDTHAVLIQTWMPQRAESEDGDNSIEQSYSLELDIERPGGKTLRLMASWLQIEGLFEHDSDIVKVAGVNKNLDGSQRLVDICAGDVVLEAE